MIINNLLKINVNKILILTILPKSLIDVFILDTNVQIYTNKTIIPPKNNKIIKYLIHLLVKVEIINLIKIEIKINNILPKRGLFTIIIKDIKYLTMIINNMILTKRVGKWVK